MSNIPVEWRPPTPEELQELQGQKQGPMRDPTPAELEELGVPHNKPGMIGRAFESVVKPVGEYVFGQPVRDPAGKPYEEAANITTGSTWKDIGAAGAYMTEGTPEGRANAIVSRIPGAKAAKDDKGNVFVDIPPEVQKQLNLKPRYIMNQPGPSWQDLRDVLNFGAETALLGKVIGAPSTLLGLGARTGAASAVMKAGSDLASQQLGTGRTPNVGEWAEAGALGAVFGVAGGALWRGLRKIGAERVANRAGELTPQARMLMERYGVNTKELTPQAVAQLKTILPMAANPAEAARLAKIKAQGVTPTKGDISQNIKVQAAEGRLYKGASPGIEYSPAEEAMRALKAPPKPGAMPGRQTQEIADSASRMVGKVTGKAPDVDLPAGTVSVTRGAEFEQAQNALKRMRDKYAQRVGALYKAGEREGAAIPPNKVASLSKELQLIKEGTNVAEAKAIADDVAKEIKKAIAGGTTPITIQRMELIRKRISELGGSSDRPTRQIAGELRQAYDTWARGLKPDDFVSGSPGAIKSIMAGRDLRARMAAKFDDDPIIKSMLQSERMADGSFKLSLNPSEAAEKIVSKIKSPSGDSVADTVVRMKTILGSYSESWQSVRREVLLKMLEKGSGTFERDLKTMLRQNPKLARELFTTKEIRQMLEHGEVAAMVGPVRETGVINNSGSGYEMLRNIQTNPLDLKFYKDALTKIPNVAWRQGVKGEPMMTPGWMLRARPDPMVPGTAYRGAIAAQSNEPESLALARRLAAMPLSR